MKEHPNFYETVKEASMRLRRTVIVYDGQPYVVLAITNHKPDGIFRIFLQDIGRDPTQPFKRPEPEGFPPDHPGLGAYMDTWMTTNSDAGVLRKKMNSPLFNKFRPYPLGMCNIKGSGTYFIERQPNRKTEQGLISSMLFETLISTTPTQTKRVGTIDVYGQAFKSCIIGDYPSAEECLSNLTNPEVLNDAAAFSRNFAFVRGPIGMIFLAYKHEIVGVLPKNSFESVRLGREYPHVKEVVTELGLFQAVTL